MARLLEQEGFEIIGRNWKTRVCEIDIVAQKGEVVYFIEVKYRSGSAQGGGFEYIAGQKLKRMEFAARVWCQTFNWPGDYSLMAAAVSGINCDEIEITEI